VTWILREGKTRRRTRQAQRRSTSGSASGVLAMIFQLTLYELRIRFATVLFDIVICERTRGVNGGTPAL